MRHSTPQSWTTSKPDLPIGGGTISAKSNSSILQSQNVFPRNPPQRATTATIPPHTMGTGNGIIAMSGTVTAPTVTFLSNKAS